MSWIEIMFGDAEEHRGHENGWFCPQTSFQNVSLASVEPTLRCQRIYDHKGILSLVVIKEVSRHDVHYHLIIQSRIN